MCVCVCIVSCVYCCPIPSILTGVSGPVSLWEEGLSPSVVGHRQTDTIQFLSAPSHLQLLLQPTGLSHLLEAYSYTVFVKHPREAAGHVKPEATVVTASPPYLSQNLTHSFGSCCSLKQLTHLLTSVASHHLERSSWPATITGKENFRKST